ncbi:ribosome biogenesis ATPase RIX7 [Cordyceps fumosorosea ARSEF 2679]|uniref:Ribosome biogenesis ATPase RIX7 n=1 Tax=Cordyceps fumosorosea (strain ARSEF 2679) TaxID=1081104 RepID=A0A162MC05_CORFA|nr:ribosome biogenesis ATPase RIX7 [Cordyceps fumosorosea ARSEF 2679]OAA54040.1 ribosome biogenesis ATPase RIX7 [Cordyceps fumosorosea ARSEF 2679]
MPPSLSNRLDLDVYHVVKRLEQSANDGRPFKTVAAAYGAVKASNSSLSRQKKRPLEDALFRVLDVRKQERAEDEDDDSEAAIDVDEPEPTTKGDERFLLNRQMTKHWNVEAAAMPAAITNTQQPNGEQPPAKKKRRVDIDPDETNMTRATSEGATGLSTPKESKESKATLDGSKLQKKTPRGPLFDVESSIDRPRLGGLGKAYDELLFDLENLLIAPQCYDPCDERLLGILLTGPSAIGKTSYVRSFAAHMGVALIDITRCFQEPERIEKALTEAFDAALASAPCLVFAAHVERYLPLPSGGDTAAHNEQPQRALALLERHMARVKAQRVRVVCVATAAREADVHPALFTGGWFDVRVPLSVPTAAERADILRAVIHERAVRDDLDLVGLARRMDGYVGGDIAQLVRHAARNAAGRSRSSHYPPSGDDTIYTAADSGDPASSVPPSMPLTLDDFAAAMKDYVPMLRKEGFTAIPNVTWDQVGGLASVREQLQLSIVGPIANPALYARFGLTRAGGCLLWGPPGCGKTLVAQAVANEAQASFILINGPELLNKYVGESERAVRELFARARSSTPCILFFDEFDSIVPRRDGGGRTSEAGTRVVNALLTELDGARARPGVYVIGTTNRPDMIDDAILRPGRLSRQLFLDLPSPEERVDILRAIYRTRHADTTTRDEEEEAALLSGVALDARCADFSGADLSGLHEKAAEFALTRYLAARDPDAPQEIAARDWEEALKVTRPSVARPEMYRKLRAKMGGAL